MLRHLAVASEYAAVRFLYAWRLGFVLVMWDNLGIGREETRVSAVWSAVALSVVLVWRSSCIWRSGMAQLFRQRF